MSFSSDIAEKWVLVIDDMESMRSQLRMSLSSSGFAKLHLVGNIKDALERMASNHYDVILCDYSLGDGTDGQQFLEYLRTHDLIGRNTIFVMITAEQAYEKVVSVTQCVPDDYLLKPFTAAQFNARLEKLLERQAYFAEIDKASDSKDWRKVVAECDRRMAVKDKYYIDLCRVKCAALTRGKHLKEAAALYREILSLRQIGWAKLGLAKVLAQLGQKEEARETARDLLRENPQYMAAYDFLSSQLALSGEKDEALQVLQQASSVSPGTMSRIRELSNLAVGVGKPELAETVMRQALQKHKYSPVRQATDYAMLSKALVNQGKADEALSVVAEAQKSFKDEHSVVVLSATESVAHRAAGNHEQAEAALMKAMEQGDMTKLPAHTVVALADACFALGKEEEATKLLHHAIQNNQEDEVIRNRIHDVLVAAGKDASEATAMIEASTREVILLNNEGVRKAEAGELEDAVALLSKAADRLPNNLQIVGNASLVLALDLVRNGIDLDKLSKCMHYRDGLVAQEPNHPKLAQIDSLLKQVQTELGSAHE